MSPVLAQVTKYGFAWEAKSLAKAKDDMGHEQPRKDEHFVEGFRHATGFNQY
jgi:hypothetical protein